MNHTRLIELLRTEYRRQWDAHQLLADQNVRLVQAGKQPADEHLIKEQRAAEAVRLARNELTAAISQMES